MEEPSPAAAPDLGRLFIRTKNAKPQRIPLSSLPEFVGTFRQSWFPTLLFALCLFLPTMPHEFTIPQRIYLKIRESFRDFIFREHVINRTASGETIKFHVGDRFGKIWYGVQHDPWPELDWIKLHGIKTGDVVIDCGANHGFTSVLFARWAGKNGSVLAVEPFPHNVEIIKKNLDLNGTKNVEIRAIAAAAQSGSIEITVEPNASVVTKSRPFKKRKKVSVRTERLDDLVPEGPVNFLKLDVEAFEAEVLRGATRILSTRPRLDLELHVMLYPDREKGLAEVFDLIDPSRYQIEIQPEVDGPLRTFDPAQDTPKSLAKHDMIHLFCR